MSTERILTRERGEQTETVKRKVPYENWGFNERELEAIRVFYNAFTGVEIAGNATQSYDGASVDSISHGGKDYSNWRLLDNAKLLNLLQKELQEPYNVMVAVVVMELPLRRAYDFSIGDKIRANKKDARVKEAVREACHYILEFLAK